MAIVNLIGEKWWDVVRPGATVTAVSNSRPRAVEFQQPDGCVLTVDLYTDKIITQSTLVTEGPVRS